VKVLLTQFLCIYICIETALALLAGSTTSRLTLGPTQPPTQWVPAALSPRVKWTGPEAYHSPPFSTKVKNNGAIPPLLHVTSWHSA
jgi:hypothetical protein